MTVQIQNLTLPDVQRAFNDIYRIIQPLQTGSLDMNGRRVVNTGKAIDGLDYVRKLELDEVANASKSESKAIRQSLLRLNGPVRVGTFATRGAAIGHAQELFIASDHNYVAWISDGAAWHWQSGENVAAQSGLSALAALLGTNDVGYIVNVSDFSHRLQWSGSAWAFAEGDDGSFYFVDTPGAVPTGGVWQLCDGSTVTYLKADGTTGSYTTKNLTGHYRKSVTSGGDATASAIAPGITGNTASGATNLTQNTQGATSGTDFNAVISLNDPGHLHGIGTIAVDATAEPAAYKVTTYFRR